MNIKARLLSLSILTVFITLILISIFPLKLNKDENFSTDIEYTSEEIKETVSEEESISKEETTIETSMSQMNQTTQEPQEEETSQNEYIYPDIYTDFTQEEIYMIQRCVETEVHSGDVISKMNVASVIFNRLNHPDKKYGDDVIAIITAPNQFAYWRTEITDTTIEAVENAYKYGDTTNGCIAYRSDNKPEKWYTWKDNYWELQFIDEVGHGFYK